MADRPGGPRRPRHTGVARLPLLGGALLFAVLALGACGDDPAGPDMPSRTSFDIDFEVRQVDGAPATARVSVSATFSQGVDEEGRPKELLDPRLGVLGDTVRPSTTEVPGVFRYELAREVPVDQLAGLSLAFRPPRVAGAEPSYDPRWTIFGGSGLDTLDVRVGEDLVVSVTLPPAEPTPPPWRSRWGAAIRLPGGGTIVGYRGDGLPPGDLRFPAELFQERGYHLLVAAVGVTHHTGSEFVFQDQRAEHYALITTVDVELQWPVRIRIGAGGR